MLPGFFVAQNARPTQIFARKAQLVAAQNHSAIVARIVELGDIIKDLTAERDALKGHLAANLPIGTHVIDGWQVIITLPQPAWSAKGKREFAKTYPVADYPELYAHVVELNTSAADQVLTDIERDAYLIPPKRQVKVI